MTMPAKSLFLFAVATMVLAFTAGPSCAWDESELEKGKVLVLLGKAPDGGKAEGRAAGIIDCPPRQVWNILNDYEHLDEYMPGIAESRVESVEGDTVIYYEETHVPILKNPWFLLRCEHDQEKLTKTMTRIDGSYRDLTAEWSLTPYGEEKTLAEYRVVSDPGYYVPRWVRKQILNRTVKGFFRGLRSACASRKAAVAEEPEVSHPAASGFD